ncbi:sensor histidine kinase [Faecalicatena sp. AGMB00832]|uniref:histidine kinase n=1 Tax=Faecalicatena faecalis TaxID=2726362 RepID=A0ABS6D1P9_9FIRM|nr:MULTISPECIES: histidine kinase [Faecalicatena]MBU3875438.1 sensor histidine kinase [Faecalicatena faecalis]MCI6468017.1 histidine kinase [Faecalicatena sp.]MDY5618494.1 histidine kinase [Lachnospiraceae bacterium]
MRNIKDTCLLFIYCFFTLFTVRADFFYVLAFLAALILCCMDYFIESRGILLLCSFLFLAAAWINPTFLYFLPAVSYLLFRRRYYALILAGGCAALYFFCLKDVNYFPFCLCIFGGILAYFMEQNTRDYEQLDSLYRHTRDDSRESNLLLTEKNHILLEKQDYEIYTATLKERNRIAREIHDNVGHLLSRSILMVGALKAVNQTSALAEPLDTLDSTLNSAMDSIRSSVHDLHDEAINLKEAVLSLLKDFTFCPVSFQYDMDREIPRDIKYSFISITKEALSNIIKHSNATQVRLVMREHPALYQLCIEDNGTEAVLSDTGIGLINMKERIQALKGNMQVQTQNGFKIFITVPKEQ